jgi:hypothetical protein
VCYSVIVFSILFFLALVDLQTFSYGVEIKMQHYIFLAQLHFWSPYFIKLMKIVPKFKIKLLSLCLYISYTFSPNAYFFARNDDFCLQQI